MISNVPQALICLHSFTSMASSLLLLFAITILPTTSLLVVLMGDTNPTITLPSYYSTVGARQDDHRRATVLSHEMHTAIYTNGKGFFRVVVPVLVHFTREYTHMFVLYLHLPSTPWFVPLLLRAQQKSWGG
jgi:hypothetical protein